MKRHFTLFEEAGGEGGGGGSGGEGSLLTQQAPPAPVAPPSTTSGDPWAIADPKTGTFTQGWTDRLPDALKPAAQDFAKYPDLATLLGSAWNAKQMVGKKMEGVKVPGPDSKPEELTAFRKALGIPEKPDGYGITKPEKLPDGVQWNDAKVAELATWAHKNNVTPAALKSLVEWNLANNATAVTTSKAAQEAAKSKFASEQATKLRTAWGSDMQAKANLATRAAVTVGLDPKSALFNNADVVLAFARIGEMMSEDKLASAQSVTSLQDPRAQAMDIQKNPANPYYARYQAGDPEIVSMVRQKLGGPA